MLFDIYDATDFRQMERVPQEIAALVIGVDQEKFDAEVREYGHCAGREYVAKESNT